MVAITVFLFLGIEWVLIDNLFRDGRVNGIDCCLDIDLYYFNCDATKILF